MRIGNNYCTNCVCSNRPAEGEEVRGQGGAVEDDGEEVSE